MATLLMLGSGVFWTLTYILIIMHGFRERTYGMPMLALCANISWEFIFSFVFPSSGIQRPVNIIWFFLDVIILVTFLLYGPGEFASLPRRTFFALFGLSLITSFCTVLFITLEFHDHGAYSAFGQNLMMSVLFILMLVRRHALRGQSLAIAICKGIGTLLASITFSFYIPQFHQSVLLPFLALAIVLYDLIYIAMVLQHLHLTKKNRDALLPQPSLSSPSPHWYCQLIERNEVYC